MTFTLQQIEWMANEVERQSASAKFVAGMARAFDHVSSHGIRDEEDVVLLACFVNMKAIEDFRQTPVTFASGGWASAPVDVPDQMMRLWDNFEPVFNLGSEQTVREFVKTFLMIHPFEDGNGRIAAILFNYLLGTMDHPVPLPNFFGD